MKYSYVVYPSLPRNFDSEVEGETLDPIVGSCDGITKWAIPSGLDNTKITMTLDMPLDYGYLVGQLESEFENCGGEDCIVLRIEKQ